MSPLSKLFKNRPQKVCKACVKLYREAQKKRPGREENDYLKFVLLSLPPYDYQFDRVIEKILKDNDTIEKLEKYLADSHERHKFNGHRKAWETRETNMLYATYLIMRNEIFFRKFRE